MENGRDPAEMSPIERSGEVAQLLARGFLRARLRKSRMKKGLDVSRPSSDSCIETSCEGEIHE
jgi:hypothetical protein